MLNFLCISSFLNCSVVSLPPITHREGQVNQINNARVHCHPHSFSYCSCKCQWTSILFMFHLSYTAQFSPCYQTLLGEKVNQSNARVHCCLHFFSLFSSELSLFPLNYIAWFFPSLQVLLYRGWTKVIMQEFIAVLTLSIFSFVNSDELFTSVFPPFYTLVFSTPYAMQKWRHTEIMQEFTAIFTLSVFSLVNCNGFSHSVSSLHCLVVPSPSGIARKRS